ncbi:winged helix-turn-helix transcriptional regulator [Paenibacillus sp. SI8]|uniref:winged helix-turn-helix transcriptional regulator n=1 Tax=unclassified Paenibacillus TaxID=185978 RepID=UPI003465E5B5
MQRVYQFRHVRIGISSNILASYLVHLEQKGVLVKKSHDSDKRKEVYLLTEKGLNLIPVLIEMASWGALNDPVTVVPFFQVQIV